MARYNHPRYAAEKWTSVIPCFATFQLPPPCLEVAYGPASRVVAREARPARVNNTANAHAAVAAAAAAATATAKTTHVQGYCTSYGTAKRIKKWSLDPIEPSHEKND